MSTIQRSGVIWKMFGIFMIFLNNMKGTLNKFFY